MVSNPPETTEGLGNNKEGVYLPVAYLGEIEQMKQSKI